MRRERPPRAIRRPDLETLSPTEFDSKNTANTVGGISLGLAIVTLLRGFGVDLPMWVVPPITGLMGFATGYLKRRKKVKTGGVVE